MKRKDPPTETVFGPTPERLQQMVATGMMTPEQGRRQLQRQRWMVLLFMALTVASLVVVAVTW